jgi:hypothetical protein
VNPNDYMGRVYGQPPCWELVADVYRSELDQAVTAFKTIDGSVRQIASAFRLALHKSPDGFQRIAAPVDFAIVLMGSTGQLGLHHCGVYWQGSVLHALPDAVLYQDLASVGDTYKLIEFWGRA